MAENWYNSIVKKLLSHKRYVLVGVTLLVMLFVIGILFFSRNQEPPLSAADKVENVEYSDLYSRTLQIGNTAINLEVKTATVYDEETGEWQSGEYRFYSTNKKPKLLATVASLIPPKHHAEYDEDPFFSMQDITNDGIPEIIVRVLQNASGLREWEILQLKNDSLENITISGQKDNPKWVTFDDTYARDGHVLLNWHGSDVRGTNRYTLNGNELVLEKSVRQTFGSGAPDSCEVSMKDANESEYTIVDSSCVDPRYPASLHRYLLFPERTELLTELYALRTNSQFFDIATAYRDNCPTTLEGATFLGAKTFQELVQRADRYRVDSGNEVFYIPCIQGAYQSSYLLTLFDGNTYTHLEVPVVQEDGERLLYPRVGEPSYNPDTGIFTNLVASNGMRSCWWMAEYKVIDREVVLQKFTADWNCEDGEISDGDVVYDINQN